jgi:hypothetical protein
MPTKMVISPSSTCIPKHLVNLMMIRGRVTAQPGGAADPLRAWTAVLPRPHRLERGAAEGGCCKRRDQDCGIG